MFEQTDLRVMYKTLSQFPQTFLTNPSKLGIYPYAKFLMFMITETLIV